MGIVTPISIMGYEPFPSRDVISESDKSLLGIGFCFVKIRLSM